MAATLRGNPVLRVSSAIAVIGVLALGVAGLALRHLVDRLRADRALVQQESGLSRSFEQLLKALKDTERERTAVEALRPPPDQLLRFVQGLEGAAAQAFIDQTITAIPPDTDVGGQSYPSPVVRYRLTLQGTMEKVEAYLRALERLPELVVVERLQLKAPPDGHVITNAAAELLVAVAVNHAPSRRTSSAGVNSP